MKLIYILVDKIPVPCDDVIEWAQWMENADRHVCSTNVGGYRVSTVFLGLRVSMGDNPPLFETLSFAADSASQEPLTPALLGIQARYRTWKEAEEGHEKIVRHIETTANVVRTPDA